MNLEKFSERLIAAARAHPPGDSVPYRFEKRVMARLGARVVPDRWADWGAALWRGAAASLGVMVLLSVITWLNPPPLPPVYTADLANHFERTLLAGVDSDTDYSQ